MKYKIWRGNTSHTPDIEKWKDTYVIDGIHLCILRELVDGENDLYWVIQNIYNQNIYLLTGVTSPVFLKNVVPDSSYSLLYVYNRDILDESWEEWKQKYLEGV